jgi:hypothetical protein
MKKKSSRVRDHDPLKLDSLFNSTANFGLLKDTAQIYIESNDVDKINIEDNIIKYIVKFNISLV